MAVQEVKNSLNNIIATQGLLYVRLHQFHWYVKGSHFFTLHNQLEELYDDVTDNMDEVAERLITIGGEPYATLEEFKENSILEEKVEDKNLSQDDMVQAVVQDYRTLSKTLDDAIKLTDKKGDDVSNDMLIAIKDGVDQSIWMLQAYLGKEATEN